MFDVPIDAWYVWLGLVTVSGAAFALAAGMPASPPPDADGAAGTVDRVAASQHDAVGGHPLPAADAVRVGSDSLSLRGDGGDAHAAFGYGPVTPAAHDDRLQRVLLGDPPEYVFDSSAAFERAIGAAQTAAPDWQQTDRLTVRRVTWGDVDVVLVG